MEDWDRVLETYCHCMYMAATCHDSLTEQETHKNNIADSLSSLSTKIILNSAETSRDSCVKVNMHTVWSRSVWLGMKE
jgi:hypothetical protein